MYKSLEFYLIVNWRTGSVRARKRKPSFVGTYGIPVKCILNIKFPEKQDLIVETSVEIPSSQITQAMLEKIDSK